MVIRFPTGQGGERSWCLQFAADSISGIEALRLTGLPIVTKTFGAEGEYVCKIGDVGTEASDCPAKDGSYWGYWRMTEQGWRHSGIGASSARVRCGSLEGWSWLPGGTGPAPSESSFSSICRSASCKASYSAISPAAGSASGSQQPGEGQPPVPVQALAAGAPDNSGEAKGSSNTGSGVAGGSPAGATVGKAPASGTVGGNPPSGGASTSMSKEGNAQAGSTEKADEASRGLALDKGRTKAPGKTSLAAAGKKTPWLSYGSLAVVIAALSGIRAFLFFRNRP